MRYAIHLREKLPQLMRVVRTGAVDMRMVIAMVNRVCLVTEPVLMGTLDVALARCAPKWMRLSGPKLEERIDWWVERLDPAGRRYPHRQVEDRYVGIWPTDSGLAVVDAQLRATDGAALERRLDALADGVCRDDPRNRRQRRADALGALAAGLSELKCECASADCTAAHRPAGHNMVIHVLAEQSTVEGAGATPGCVPGFGPLPVSAVHSLAATSKVKPLAIPNPGPRRSRGIARRRRWPSCSVPRSDLPVPGLRAARRVLRHRPHRALSAGRSDSSVESEAAVPVSSLTENLLHRCGGWADTQLPDGTIIWTSPTGRTYTTKPGGALFFPILATPTGEATIRKLTTEPGQGRGL